MKIKYINKVADKATLSKHIISNKKFYLAFIIIIFGAAYYYYSSKNTDDTVISYSVVSATKGPISNEISGTGQIVPVNTLELKTKTSGDISQVLVSAGDIVKKGQPLVKLNATDALQRLRSAEVNLESAKLDLERLMKPAEDLSLIQIKNTIARLEDQIREQDITVNNAYKNLLNASFEAVPNAVNTVDTPPTISGSYSGTQEGQIKIEIMGTGDGARFNASGLATGSGYVSTTTPQPIGNSGLYIKFNSSTSVSGWLINIPNTKAANYFSLKNNYTNAITNRETAVVDLKRSIEENELKLEDLENGADSLDIRQKKLVIQQRQNDLAQAQSDYADSIVTAPFAGTIATLTADIGTTVNSGVSLGTIITNKTVAEISLNEVDIAKLKLGEKGSLTFDAVEGLVATSTVAEIDTLGVSTQGVVTYKVKLISENKDSRIKPGMSVTANIVSERKEDAITVPLSAIVEDKEGTYVEVVVGNYDKNIKSLSIKPQVNKVYVKQGITVGSKIEIIEGLSGEEEILITRKLSTKVSTSTGSLFNFGGTNTRTSASSSQSGGIRPGSDMPRY